MSRRLLLALLLTSGSTVSSEYMHAHMMQAIICFLNRYIMLLQMPTYHYQLLHNYRTWHHKGFWGAGWNSNCVAPSSPPVWELLVNSGLHHRYSRWTGCDMCVITTGSRDEPAVMCESSSLLHVLNGRWNSLYQLEPNVIAILTFYIINKSWILKHNNWYHRHNNSYQYQYQQN